MIGRTIGPYRVLDKLGEGGMGEVYRATDVNLKRTVAIKVLPEAFAADADRLARFQREAEVLARLNHPHIAQIHGLEKSPSTGSGQGGAIALVMELVEGPTLADRIAQGPVPVDEALAIARQIAEALEAAHDQHIIHRDLKPANIKTRPDGTVKVLDFGLAKALDPASSSGLTAQGNLSHSPTITSPAMTQMGMILGTAAFMSPEQAKGQPVDKRADIWAFGCVLYEMLTGRRAFGGEDVSDTLAAVLRSEPDWQALPSDLPPAVRLLIERSLVKDRRRRMGDISTALFLLNETLPLAPLPVGPAVRPRVTGRLVAVAGMSLAVGATLATLVLRGIERAAAPVTQRLSLALPDDRAIGFGPLPGSSLAISPDGTRVAYVSPNPGAPAERTNQLRVRSLSSLEAVDLPGAFQAHQPFFSPDGGSVAFFTPSGELKKISVAGGNPVTLVDKINGSSWAFGVWIDPDTIVFGAFGTGGLRQVPADGGPLKEITSINAAQGEVAHMPTAFVPEQGVVVFTTAFSQLRETQIEALILGSGERRVITENAGSGRYLSTGHLLFRRGDAEFVAPLDVERLALAGPAVAISDDVRRDGANSEGSVPQLAVSSNGTLAYVRSAGISANSIGRLGRRGESFEPFKLPPTGRIRRPRVSPDGQRVTFEAAGDGGRTVYETTVHVHDLVRGTVSRLTESGSESQTVWRPDGKGMAVYARRQDDAGIYLRDAGGREQLVLRNDDAGVNLRPESFSPDGTVLAYARQQGSRHSIWLLTLGDKPVARSFTRGTSSEHSPKFSPNGRWVAYVASDGERSDVHVRGYPSGEPIPVSPSGGTGPVWSRDGRTLFYESPQSGEPALMSVSVSAEGETLKLGAPVRVLSLVGPAVSGGEEYGRSFNWGPEYDVFPDGSFAISRGFTGARSREIVLVQHWFEEVKRLAPRR
jgi:serine/threonine-protein kinase